jgi:hypothetical protein
MYGSKVFSKGAYMASEGSTIKYRDSIIKIINRADLAGEIDT